VSATGRSDVRDPSDYYSSPPWTVHRLLEAVELPGGLWLEPTAGEGAIINAVAEKRRDVVWHAVEAREECIPILDAIPTCQVAVRGSFQAVPVDTSGRYACLVGNPPYRSALQIVQHALEFAPIVVMLLRLNWLASDKRVAWIRANTPSVFVLPDRPSFVGESGDATEYAWMAWGLGIPTVSILGSTPLSERRASHTPRARGQLSLIDDERKPPCPSRSI